MKPNDLGNEDLSQARAIMAAVLDDPLQDLSTESANKLRSFLGAREQSGNSGQLDAAAKRAIDNAVSDGASTVGFNVARYLAQMMLKNINEHISRLDSDTAAVEARNLGDAVELAYGLLCLVPDNKDPPWRGDKYRTLCIYTARRLLASKIDRAGASRGIEAARVELTGDFE